MLKSLHIKNYAIVDELAVEFSPGLSVLTGETGAGKSILVGAVGLLLGERAQTEMVRTGAEVAVVEGVFVLPRTKDRAELLAAAGIDESLMSTTGELRVRREVYRKGAGRCFINEGLMTLAGLKAFGERIGDLCGQHQHQSLLDPRAHVRFLDERAGLADDARAYREAFEQLKADTKKLDEIVHHAAQRRQAHELTLFQVSEIRAAALAPTEEDDLKTELAVVKNARRLLEAVERAKSILAEDADSAADRLAAARKELQSLAAIDPRLGPPVELLEQCASLVGDIGFELNEYSSKIDFDPARAEHIEARLTEIFRLKQKYGSTCAQILDRLHRLEQEVAHYHEEDSLREELAKRINARKAELADRAQTLSRFRKNAAKRLAEDVNAILAEVGMKGSAVRVRFDPVAAGPVTVAVEGREVPLSENGFEEIEFAIETNPGEGFKPLVKIASGGELSRVMLALKAVGEPGRDVSLVVFDEVDSGIGGQVAHAVARQLKTLAKHYQVFLVSHLQQMASLADHHYKVVKKKSGGRVTTHIQLLNDSERIEEIARMMAAEKITDATRKHAAEMIKPAAKR